MSKQWAPSLVTLGLTIVSLFNPDIQHFLTTHPQASAGIAGIYAIIKGLLPSPIAQKTAR